jgi:glycosyltransferase involved in cell wall biosynthesis
MKERFDIVICHMPWSLAIFGKAVRAAGQKIGFWAHAFHTGRNWLDLLARRIPPDVAIGNSRFTEAGLSNLFPDTPHGVIYPPVALTQPAEAGEWRSSIRREMEAADKVVIIQVSRMEACKGHFLHLEALARLKHLGTWVCWIVGGPQRREEHEYLGRIRQAAEKAGIAERLRFLGQRSDVPRLLAGADIFCQPNVTPDSFGISLVEALWAGRPVVTTAMGGAKEIIDGSCGFLVAPGEPGALAASLERLIESSELRSRLGRAGAGRALQLCDPTTQMKSLSDLSRDVCRRENG